MAKTVTIIVSHKTLLYVAIGAIVVALLVLNAYAFLRPSGNGNKGTAAPLSTLGGGNDFENTAENFNAAKAAENPQDKCATPPGYTDAEWKEHMGHHPEQYEGCL